MAKSWDIPDPQPPGECYLVGGAVRDALLGLEVKERDWVVVGSTPQAMLDAGFRPVGKDFPVFLHPVTKEEYALARTERKNGHGYAGFEFYASSEVSLEQDLARRDLSINAIAQAADGKIIDVYGGQSDLDQRILRHVSAHFVEDPLRVLRIARFKARFHQQGFDIHEATYALLQQISESGELAHLTPERCWKETEKALLSPAPAEFFRALQKARALGPLFPEIEGLFGVPQTAKYHPEIDSGVHTLMALEQAARLSPELSVRFATLCHDLGKATTPARVLPSHHGHEARGVPLIETLCQRLKIPRQLKEAAQIVAEYHLHCHKAFELRADTLLGVFEAMDAFRRPERMEIFALSCEADSKGRTGLENEPYPQAEFCRQALAHCSAVSAQSMIAQGHTGKQISRALRAARIEALNALKASL